MEKLNKIIQSKKFLPVLFGAINLLLGCLLVAFHFLSKNVMLDFSILLVVFVLDIYAFSYQKQRKNRLTLSLEDEFVEIFSYFSVYLENGYPVYSSLKETLKFCSIPMEILIRELLTEIDNDKTVAPFISFSCRFSSLTIKEVMVSIFQMVDEGYQGDYVTQFQILFNSLEENKRKGRIDRKASTLGLMTVLPLVGSALTMALISVGISSIIGGAMNGF